MYVYVCVIVLLTDGDGDDDSPLYEMKWERYAQAVCVIELECGVIVLGVCVSVSMLEWLGWSVDTVFRLLVSSTNTGANEWI